MTNQGKDRFIILRKMKYGEADLILHALSPRGEKLSFIARGALRSKKRFGGGILEPSHFVTLTYKPASDHGQLNVLEEATLVSDFAGIRADYDKLELALHVLECVSKVSQEGDQDSEFLFNLLGHTLRAIESAQDVLVLKMHFYLKFLLQQGVVNAEPWMAPFLKTNLNQTNTLLNHRQLVDEELSNVEAMVRHYLQHAVI
ncbi:MAG TPA: DNA repair protein RecO [Bdellovibrio sp.]|nr:DNA repair protein RecO [Bdellovibrio sp.]